MKTEWTALMLLGLSISFGLRPAWAQDTGFLYQGELNYQGVPAQGAFDFRVGAYPAESAGEAVNDPVVLVDQPVMAGVFFLPLDFGLLADEAPALWLEVEVRASGQSTFTPLTPRWQIPVSAATIIAFSAARNAAGTSSLINRAVTSTRIADNAVSGPKLAPGAVGAAQLAPASVAAVNIQSGAVTGIHLAPGAVGVAELAPDAVLSSKLANNAVGASELAPSAVTTAKLTASSVTSSDIAPGSVGLNETVVNHIQSGAVGSTQLASGSVGSSQINASQVQRRISGSCPPGQAIRSVSSTGSVVCAADRRGVVGLGNPVISPFEFSFGDGFQTRTIGSYPTQICQLSYVSLREIDNANETGSCRVGLDVGSNQWFLEAFVTPGRDGDATCAAVCQTIVRSP